MSVRNRPSNKADAPLSCRDCALGPRTVYRGVHRQSPDHLTAARSCINRLKPHRIVFHRGEVPDKVFTVYKGWLCRYRDLGRGRYQILNFIIPGDTITLSSMFMPGQPLSFSVKTLTDVEVCGFSADTFRSMLSQKAEYLQPYHQDLSGYLDTVTTRLADLGQRSAKGRMAQLFVELYRRHQKRQLLRDGGFPFPISQEILANALGITKSYVNRTLSTMRDEELILLEDGKLTVPDLPALEKCASIY